MRVLTSSYVGSAALFLMVACGDGGSPAANPASGPTTGGGSTATGNTSGAGGSSGAAGGSSMVGAGGSSPTGTTGPTTTTGPFSGAGGDNGGLFPKDASVPVNPGGGGSKDAGSTPEAALSDTGNKPPGDGNVAISHLMGSLAGTAEFTQHGVDVTVVVKLTNCATGAHPIRIHGGYSCDNADTMGIVWDGKRGDGIGGTASTITCDASKVGSLTYTRLGNDPTQNWTVADHNLPTDVTSHVVIISDVAIPTTRIACGNFF
jgi:hypothetical protein